MAASAPVVARIEDSGREIHSRIVGGLECRDDARCDEQAESDTIIDDVEAFYRYLPERLGPPEKLLP